MDVSETQLECHLILELESRVSTRDVLHVSESVMYQRAKNNTIRI